MTAKTQTTISLAWNASSDNSGNLTYELHLWQDPRVPILPKTQTSFTWTGLRPNVQYYLWVIAIDAAGIKAFSDQLTVTTLRDTTPPTAPGNLRVDSVSASQVVLSWDASTDATGIAAYGVSVSPAEHALQWTGPTSVNVIGLAPDTQFTFWVRATDFGYNASPPSNTVTATTLASTDVTPPSAPTNLSVSDWGCEIEAQWTASTDDQDQPAAIRYLLHINGEPDQFGAIIGMTRTISYGVVTGPNRFTMRAIDSAGNMSAPSNAVTLPLTCP